MDLGLRGMKALVVAASAGLGYATAQQLAMEGANVVICGRSQERLETAVASLKEETGADVAAFVADVAQADDIERLVQNAVEHLGGLDILVTNAGGPAGGTFDTVSFNDWGKSINLTLLSAARLIKEALPALRQSEAASILTITSISAKQSAKRPFHQPSGQRFKPRNRHPASL